jgi:hypothetical protein
MSVTVLTAALIAFLLVRLLTRMYDGQAYQCPVCGTTREDGHIPECPWKGTD